MREVVSESENPVMLYSIGKDSSVMLRLAMKAFHPAKLPFPLLHVDTLWKFSEMIEFRDAIAREMGLDLIVHVNHEGAKMGIDPFVHGPSMHTDIMKTQALKQALKSINSTVLLAEQDGMRRSQGLRSEFSHSGTRTIIGIQKGSDPNYGTYTTQKKALMSR